MSAGEITIRIPGVSPPIPELVISEFPTDPYTMTFDGLAQVADFSAYGTPQIAGPLTDRYLIAVSCYQSQQDALQLAAMVRWSSEQYKAKADGHLELDFELEYLTPEPSPHSRTLIATLNPSWNAGYEYGYGRLSVAISLGEDYSRLAGRRFSNGESVSLFQFSAVEV